MRNGARIVPRGPNCGHPAIRLAQGGKKAGRERMKKKVLIVEDTNDIGEALRQLIEMQGYRAFLAESGHEGIRVAREERPDLILMDLSMPDLDGLSATRAIRSHPELANTPIVCVSSYTGVYEEEVLEAEFSEIFSKSTFIGTYKETLKKYLEN